MLYDSPIPGGTANPGPSRAVRDDSDKTLPDAARPVSDRATDRARSSQPHRPCSKQRVTRLLYPFVTNQAGFDTGLEISNTTADPFGTTPVPGVCKLTFYGSNPPSPVVTPTIAAGQNWETVASAVARVSRAT